MNNINQYSLGQLVYAIRERDKDDYCAEYNNHHVCEEYIESYGINKDGYFVTTDESGECEQMREGVDFYTIKEKAQKVLENEYNQQAIDYKYMNAFELSRKYYG